MVAMAGYCSVAQTCIALRFFASISPVLVISRYSTATIRASMGGAAGCLRRFQTSTREVDATRVAERYTHA